MDRAVPSIPAFYACYLLRSTPRHASTYIGSTPNPLRRLRQHNGETKGGAARTSRDSLRPWEMTCLVTGFPSKVAALQFEWAWQNAHLTRHIAPDSRPVKIDKRPPPLRPSRRPRRPRMSLTDRLAHLHLLLRTPSFERWPLTVTFYNGDVYKMWQKWTKQQFDRLRESISVSMDDSSVREKAAGPPPRGIAAGISSLDVTYEQMGRQLQKSQTLLDGSSWMECSSCKAGLPPNGAGTLFCPHDGCDAMYHMQCLSAKLLICPAEADHLIPIAGSCQVCNGKVAWITLVKELSLRMRGVKGSTKIQGERSPVKGATPIYQNPYADDESDDSPLSDLESDTAPIEAKKVVKKPRKSKIKSTKPKDRDVSEQATDGRNRVVADSDSDWRDAEILV